MAIKIQLRRDTAANWTANNPTLAQGEGGIETDTHFIKWGDGSTAWNSLAYQATQAHASTHASGGSDAITIAESQVTNLTSDLAAKAPLASPTFTGTPAAPTASASVNSTQIATTAYTTTGISTHAALTATHGVSGAIVGTTDTQTLTNKTMELAVFKAPTETWTVSASAASASVQFDVKTQGVLYYTTSASANWILNIRGDSSTTLNSIMSVGQAITVVFMATQGGTAYYQTAVAIDGTNQTVKYSGGTAPSSGNASSVDVYSITIVKTGSSTYSVFGGQAKFA